MKRFPPSIQHPTRRAKTDVESVGRKHSLANYGCSTVLPFSSARGGLYCWSCECTMATSGPGLIAFSLSRLTRAGSHRIQLQTFLTARGTSENRLNRSTSSRCSAAILLNQVQSQQFCRVKSVALPKLFLERHTRKTSFGYIFNCVCASSKVQ